MRFGNIVDSAFGIVARIGLQCPIAATYKTKKGGPGDPPYYESTKCRRAKEQGAAMKLF